MVEVHVDTEVGNGVYEYGTIDGRQVIDALYYEDNLSEADRREMLEDADRFTAVVVDQRVYEHMKRDLDGGIKMIEQLLERIEEYEGWLDKLPSLKDEAEKILEAMRVSAD